MTIPWGDIRRTGKTATGYWYVEAEDGRRVYWSYLYKGYGAFVQALAELTPDRKDFVITYVVEEGPRYKFGKVDAQSALPDLPASKVKSLLKIQPGSWFNAKAVEDESPVRVVVVPRRETER